MSAPYADMFPFYLHSATSAGAGGGDEDPHRNPYWLKSSHEANVPGDQNPHREETETDQSAQAKRINRKSPERACPVCLRSFLTTEALNGHIRFHHYWTWCVIMPPEQCDPQIRGDQMGAGSTSAAEASGGGGGGIEWRFKCHNCGAKFRTGQALGGHKKGCNRLARERFIEHPLGGASINNDNSSRDGSAQGSRILDLNLPPPEEEDA